MIYKIFGSFVFSVLYTTTKCFLLFGEPANGVMAIYEDEINVYVTTLLFLFL